MGARIGKIVLSVVLSFIFFIPAAIIIDSLAGLIFGAKSGGGANVNGYVMLVINTLITVAFGVWFYKYVRVGKKNKSEASDIK